MTIINNHSFLANLLINKIYENKLIASGAMLIAVRPLLIEGKTVFDHFQQFIPPKGYVVDHFNSSKR